MNTKSPKFLKPHEGLTATQRKSLGLEKVPPRERQAGEAMGSLVMRKKAKTPEEALAESVGTE